jgi:hypothetical protein
VILPTERRCHICQGPSHICPQPGKTTWAERLAVMLRTADRINTPIEWGDIVLSTLSYRVCRRAVWDSSSVTVEVLLKYYHSCSNCACSVWVVGNGASFARRRVPAMIPTERPPCPALSGASPQTCYTLRPIDGRSPTELALTSKSEGPLIRSEPGPAGA